MTAKGRIAAATYQITLAHVKIFLIYNGQEDVPQNALGLSGNSRPPLNTWFLGPMHPSPYPKRHLDWFIRFVGLTAVANRRTHTNHATSVTIGRIL